MVKRRVTRLAIFYGIAALVTLNSLAACTPKQIKAWTNSHPVNVTSVGLK